MSVSILAAAATAATEAAEAVEAAEATDLQQWGAFAFGAVLGWILYYLNRYRKEVRLADLTTVIGAIGGAGVLALFPAETDLFGAYGVGLAAGFFGYFLLLVVLVAASKDFTKEFLLDGRRRMPDGTVGYPEGTDRPMAAGGGGTLPPGA